MDKWDGHLRITATTSETVNWTTKNTHKIYVLEIPSIGDGPGPMKLVGESENLADMTGYITGARFVGDKAYITANAWAEKETNEFVVVDLSVHSDPHIVGNLEVSSFGSSYWYLHHQHCPNIAYILCQFLPSFKVLCTICTTKTLTTLRSFWALVPRLRKPTSHISHS
jgi:uncharacterized secreted protein with C-terminal beta-propeller domain